MDGELSGQVVIITGAGRGIGRALVTELAAAGARLVLVARTRTERTPWKRSARTGRPWLPAM